MDVLLSYAYHATTDLAWVRRRLGKDSCIIIDSGAYTAFHSRTGRQITLNDYAAYLKEWEPEYTGAVSLDVVHNPTATRRNYQHLLRKGCRVMPVFQTGTPLTEFDAMVKDAGYVAVGGIGGMGHTDRTLRARYVTMLARRAREHRGHVHLLGVNGEAVFRSGCYSADTSAPSKAILRGLGAFYNGRRMLYLPVMDQHTWFRHRDLLLGYELPGSVAGQRWWKDRIYRRAVLTAGMWGFWAESQQLQRRKIPAPKGAPKPGTRIVAAVLNKEVLEMVLPMQERIDAGDLPRSVKRVLGVHA